MDKLEIAGIMAAFVLYTGLISVSVSNHATDEAIENCMKFNERMSVIDAKQTCNDIVKGTK